MNKFTLEWDLEIKDLRRFLIFNLTKTPYRWPVLLVHLVPLAFPFYTLLTTEQIDYRAWWIYLMQGLTSSVVIFLLLTVLIIFLPKKRYKTPGYEPHRELGFTEDYFYLKTPVNDEVQYKWENLTRIRFVKDWVVFHTTKSRTIPIPIDKVDPEIREDFIKFIKSKA